MFTQFVHEVSSATVQRLAVISVTVLMIASVPEMAHAHMDVLKAGSVAGVGKEV